MPNGSRYSGEITPQCDGLSWIALEVSAIHEDLLELHKMGPVDSEQYQPGEMMQDGSYLYTPRVYALSPKNLTARVGQQFRDSVKMRLRKASIAASAPEATCLGHCDDCKSLSHLVDSLPSGFGSPSSIVVIGAANDTFGILAMVVIREYISW